MSEPTPTPEAPQIANGDHVGVVIDLNWAKVAIYNAIEARAGAIRHLADAAIERYLSSGVLDRQVEEFVGGAVRSAVDAAARSACYDQEIQRKIRGLVLGALKRTLGKPRRRQR